MFHVRAQLGAGRSRRREAIKARVFCGTCGNNPEEDGDGVLCMGYLLDGGTRLP